MLLGIDIGGTKCAVILDDAEGEDSITILDKIVMPTNKPAYEMIDELFNSGNGKNKSENKSNELSQSFFSDVLPRHKGLQKDWRLYRSWY
ncbi:MAG: hypothetical protein M3Z26_01245 [Bacteroidota bacterium]|nr:hypothetical protein [Bacteroidota bacterium]